MSPLILSFSVIDFGFAKKVPYTTKDINTGEVKVHAKTFTLCGTPGAVSHLGKLLFANFLSLLFLSLMDFMSTPEYSKMLKNYNISFFLDSALIYNSVI
jgi:hypothetical protein